jgi:DNA integrity scanning protein DisA with diadenylate cyclase activity
MPIPSPSKILKRFIRTVAAFPKFEFLTAREQDILANVLSHSKDGASPELKLKIYHALKRLKKRRRKPFGMLIVLGWKREWMEKYASMPDKTQNVFAGRPFDFGGAPENRAVAKLAELADFDGAILMNERGEIVASGIYLESMQTKRLAEILAPDHAADMSAAFGFAKKVHTRHMAGIAASYWLKDTTVFVVSEEDGSIRIFERGRIIFSTVEKEMHR